MKKTSQGQKWSAIPSALLYTFWEIEICTTGRRVLLTLADPGLSLFHTLFQLRLGSAPEGEAWGPGEGVWGLMALKPLEGWGSGWIIGGNRTGVCLFVRSFGWKFSQCSIGHGPLGSASQNVPKGENLQQDRDREANYVIRN